MKSILFTNGKIYTLENERRFFSYMGIKGNKISYLGNDVPEEPYEETIDLNGQYIFPSLTDSHMHLLYTMVLSGQSFNVCDITSKGVSPRNLRGIENRLKEYIAKHPNNKLIVGTNYIASGIKENRLPTRMELDRWSNNKEVVIMNIDGHSVSLSTVLLKKLKLFDEKKNGILMNKEFDMISDKITDYIASSVSFKTLLDGYNNFQNDCIKYGIGKVCALEGNDNDKKDIQLSLITYLARRMDIKVRLYPQYHSLKKVSKLFKKMTSKRIGGCNKWELDGSVGSFSAAFYKSYNNGTISNTYYESQYVYKKVKEFNDLDIQFTAHAIGTKAIDQLADAYSLESHRINRIDHFEFPSKTAILKVSKHNIAVTIQPGYSYIDLRYLHSYERNLPKEIIDSQVPLDTCVKKGICLLGSSDSPVQSINPFIQLAGMTDFYIKEQSISNYEALKTYTINPNRVLEETDAGMLKVGNIADFIITKHNILKTAPNDLPTLEVEKLYLDGQEVKKQTSRFKTLFKILFKKPRLI